MPVQHLRADFMKRFGGGCNVFRAPGRVNLIGEHTDYNEGYVLPVAIGFDTYVACAETATGKVAIHSLQQTETAEFPIHDSAPHPGHNWTDYVRGVLIELQRLGHNFRGANLLIDGHVPMGAGLSSSAALETATALALLSLSRQPMDHAAIARLCQRAENDFVGSRCGIMDQFVSLNAQAGNALLLDCRSLDVRFIPLPPDATLVICNTMVRHSHAEGEYNARRAECEAGVGYFAQYRDGIKALRAVAEDDLRQHGEGLSPVTLRRCRHVITENARVLSAANALASCDLPTFGRLMYESHNSLKLDYEVSCPELDIMVELASRIPGIYGSRMTGGGFGGCTINLVENKLAEKFSQRIAHDYHSATRIRPDVY